ncbi:SCO family protein [Thiomicrorhabdus sediminis]|uniref:SCO family protein n=1 Tax=Thiomicrorhabdus sediminis TaxID=2580412 RepID=A0A4P9K3P7_9GAMM|nr:SCO family protein [Thiomicrorhabdus sediminis]QCU89485.1 SCO family protein [Thiomicrorhabdus sediminis]
MLFAFFLSISLALFLLGPMALYHFSTGEYHGKKVLIPAPDFSLKDTHNQAHSLSQHQGKYTFIYFGYINCDGVCHNQVGTLFNVDRQNTSKQMDFLFITLDPDRDTVEMLTNYFDNLGKNFYALYTDNKRQLQNLTAQYKNYFYADKLGTSRADYRINHPGKIYLINPQGQIKLIYQNQFVRYDQILADLEKLENKQTAAQAL